MGKGLGKNSGRGQGKTSRRGQIKSSRRGQGRGHGRIGRPSPRSVLVDEPGMNMRSDVDAVTLSYPSFLPSLTPGPNIFFDSEIIDTNCVL